MNVFNIKKQCDEKLIYSNHAIERATKESAHAILHSFRCCV